MKVGNQVLQLKAENAGYDNTLLYSFTVKVIMACEIADIDYKIASGPLTRDAFDMSNCFNAQHVQTIEYTLDGQIVSPDFISFDSNTQEFTIESSDTDHLGVYSVRVTSLVELTDPSTVTESTFTLAMYTYCTDWQLEFEPAYLLTQSVTYTIGQVPEAISIDLTKIRTQASEHGCELVGRYQRRQNGIILAEQDIIPGGILTNADWDTVQYISTDVIR